MQGVKIVTKYSLRLDQYFIPARRDYLLSLSVAPFVGPDGVFIPLQCMLAARTQLQ